MDDFETSNALTRLWRAVRSTIGRGRIKLVDDTKAVQKAQLVLSANEIVDNLIRVGEYGLASNPPTDSDAIVVFIAGDRTKGAIVGTNHQASRLKNLQRGEVAIFDDQGRWIWLKRGSIEIDAKNTPVDVKNATVITAKATTKITLDSPLVECTGQITSQGSITSQATVTGTTDVVGGGKSLKTHVHGGVVAGGANSGPPV
ncbi:MAG: phage baseplate assembly protein V [Alphaproteobacteria bacterium]|nr:phage baseplate assembly protein V [Alphaproteobacteria bacterium]